MSNQPLLHNWPQKLLIGEITQNNGHYAVQGHSRSRFWYQSRPIWTWLILTCLLSCTVSKLWLIIGQIFASNRGCFTLTPSLGVIPYKYMDKLYLSSN